MIIISFMTFLSKCQYEFVGNEIYLLTRLLGTQKINIFN